MAGLAQSHAGPPAGAGGTGEALTDDLHEVGVRLEVVLQRVDGQVAPPAPSAEHHDVQDALGAQTGR